MSTSDHQNLRGSWPVAGWLLLILSGGLMTSLIRAPHVLSSMTPILVMSHLIGGVAMTIIAIARLKYAKEMMRSWRLLLLAATPRWGGSRIDRSRHFARQLTRPSPRWRAWRLRTAVKKA